MSIKTRNFSNPWLIGALAVLTLIVVACSSRDAEDQGVTSSTDGARAGTSADSGVLVTQSTSDDVDTGIWIGVETAAIPEIFDGLLGFLSGERVVWVTPGGPADGVLIMGDTITALDGDLMDAENGLHIALEGRAELGAGDSISLSIVRGGEASKVQITLANKPADGASGGLNQIEELLDRALSGELRFLDSYGGEHAVSFGSGTLSGVSADVNSARLTLAQPGKGPSTVTLSPNIFVWIDGTPGTIGDLENATGTDAKIFTYDGVAQAVLVGGVIPPALDALEGLLGGDGDGLLEVLSLLEGLGDLGTLFGGQSAPSGALDF